MRQPTKNFPAVNGNREGFSGKAHEMFLQFGQNTALLLLAAVLFAASFPNPLSQDGFGFLGFIALFPFFIVIHRSTWKGICVYAAISALFSYSLFNFWLAKFHPLAIFIVPFFMAGYAIILFPLLKLADSLFPRWGFLLQVPLWAAYEYSRTIGFIAYPYGLIGYSQSNFDYFIQIASLGGLWPVTALTIFPSILLGNALKNGRKNFVPFVKKTRIAIGIWCLLSAGSIIYGAASQADYREAPTKRIALIQHNVDPWKGGPAAYEKNFSVLKRLTDLALRQKPDIVVWPETAFVPAFDFHLRYRPDPSIYELVKRLKTYLDGQTIPFLFGNDDGELEIIDAKGNYGRVDYNAALLYDPGKSLSVYRKMKLVPFTEYFPYKETFPGIYKLLEKADTHFWKPGKDPKVFNAAGIKFSTPICFEDTFGWISRQFVNNGAELIVNLTNDSWSNSVECEMQHMQIAKFRAIENRRTVIRCANGGITCVIDPNGRLLASLPAFTEASLVYDVPVFKEGKTLYRISGDAPVLAASIISFVILGFALASGIFRTFKKRKKMSS